MEIQNTLALRIPERSKAPAGAFLAKPKEVSNWVARLPMANVGETSRQVFKTLVEFNRLEIPSAAHIKVAELFLPPVKYIANNLRKYYFDVAFPLSAKNRKIAVLNRELYAELAISYKIFIDNMVTGKSGKFDKKLLVISIHRAVRYLSLMLYQSAIFYDPYPAHTWAEIHKLYAYAERNGVHELPIREGNDKEGTSISDLYKQILLFSVCTPFTLRQREIEHIFGVLPEWSALITLERPTEVDDQPGYFISDMRSDAPPVHAMLYTREVSANCRILNLHGLLKALKASFDELPPELSSSDSRTINGHSSRPLLRQLIHLLGTTPKRKFVRTRLNFELKVAIGLSAIYTLTTENQKMADMDPESALLLDDDAADFDPPQDEQNTVFYTAETASLNISADSLSLESNSEINSTIGSGSISSKTVTPSWAKNATIDEETVISSTAEGFGFGPGTTTPGWATYDKLHDHETFSCKTINESAGGYCINWHGSNLPQIKVGEILGIESATSRNQFSIGVIRWMRNGPRQHLQIGMQVIAPNSVAIQARPTEKSDYNRIPQKCLLLPELKATGQPATLIVPTLPFKVKDTLWINDSVGEQQIRLTRLLESTGAFSQFQFVYLHGEDSAEITPEEEADSNFENIWSML